MFKIQENNAINSWDLEGDLEVFKRVLLDQLMNVRLIMTSSEWAMHNNLLYGYIRLESNIRPHRLDIRLPETKEAGALSLAMGVVYKPGDYHKDSYFRMFAGVEVSLTRTFFEYSNIKIVGEYMDNVLTMLTNATKQAIYFYRMLYEAIEKAREDQITDVLVASWIQKAAATKMIGIEGLIEIDRLWKRYADKFGPNFFSAYLAFNQYFMGKPLNIQEAFYTQIWSVIG